MASYQSHPSRVSSSMSSRSGSSRIKERTGGFLTDSPSDSTRITRMKTRVAVRDKTPHRFQVVPLRDVSKHGPEIPQSSAPSHLKNNAQRNLSGKLGPYSQSRQHPPSPSNQRILGVSSTHESRELDGTNWELNVNNTLATAFYNKPSTASHSAMPSLKLQHEVPKPVLAEWDMNQESPIQVPRLSHSITPRGRKTNPQFGGPKSSPYQGAMNASTRSEIVPTHTTSQSLHITTLPKRNYPKFASLGQSSIDILGSLPGTPLSEFENVNPGIETKYRNFAEARTSNKDESVSCEANDVLPSDDNQQSLKAKSSRRHAIYTESLYVPYLDEGYDFHARESTPKSSRLCYSDLHAKFAPTLRTKNLEFANPDLGFSLERALPTNILPSNRAPLLSTRRARPSTIAEPRGLYYPIDKPSRARVLSGKDISHSEIVYSCIVLDLFADINLAIEQWKSIL
ncbi:hypothetical protein M413DRAFT_425709 [Hebeloma cylindrosporum]|uniref:Uncharacterized protein n=1 Tax=Hebeloma cylindrosporum TaxID=76867 RepID=A0A0C3CB12_HEBCY|nr:hypothetical protein M413DRAFT_425709 [Hebeloma cylindrosporum h7]